MRRRDLKKSRLNRPGVRKAGVSRSILAVLSAAVLMAGISAAVGRFRHVSRQRECAGRQSAE